MANKYKIFLSFMLVMFFTYLAVNYIEQTEENKKVVVQLKKEQKYLDTWLSKKKRMMEDFALFLSSVEYSKKEFLKHMNNAKKSINTYGIFSGFEDGLYMDTQGIWEKNYDPREKAWYQNTIATKGTIVLGPMYYNDVSGQQISYLSIGTTYFKDKKPFGVIGAEVHSSAFEKYFEKSPLIKKYTIYLIHKDTGVIIFSSKNIQKDQLIQSVISESFYEELISHKDGIFSFQHFGKTKKAYASNLVESPWVLCALTLQ